MIPRIPWSTLNYATSIGRSIAHETMGKGYNRDAKDSIYRIPSNQLTAFMPNFNTVILEGSAEPLDLLRSVPIPPFGMLISERFRVLLSSFGLPAHQVYPVPMTQKGRPVNNYY